MSESCFVCRFTGLQRFSTIADIGPKIRTDIMKQQTTFPPTTEKKSGLHDADTTV